MTPEVRMGSEPRVSIVTPFYNTAEYLADCIESVLAQSYRNFEYVLLDNCSTDGSREIAERYAARDPRIQLHRPEEFLDQLPNFNRALERIDPASRYVKMVLADDLLLPGCLEQMVALAEREPGVGLVSSYYLYGEQLDGYGIPLGQDVVPGREALRKTFLTASTERQLFFVGTPTCVLYRADLVRSRSPFFTPGLYHADTERAYELLLHHDLGFVHQVLSFVRTDNDGITSARAGLCWEALDRYIVVKRYAEQVLSKPELELVRRRVTADYFGSLGRMALRLRGPKFWAYHRTGLATAGEELRWWRVAPWAAAEVVRMAASPGETIGRVLRWRRRRRAAAIVGPTVRPAAPRASRGSASAAAGNG